MITRALIEALVDEYSVQVRMPYFNGANNTKGSTTTADLNTARICVPPSIYPQLHVGDAVFVGFEDNDYGKPVVLGLLYNKNSVNISSNIQAINFAAVETVTLPTDTSIGKVTNKQIGYLSGVNQDLQQQLNDLFTRVDTTQNNLLTFEQVQYSGDPPTARGIFSGQMCYTYTTNISVMDNLWLYTTNTWQKFSGGGETAVQEYTTDEIDALWNTIF